MNTAIKIGNAEVEIYDDQIGIKEGGSTRYYSKEHIAELIAALGAALSLMQNVR